MSVYVHFFEAHFIFGQCVRVHMQGKLQVHVCACVSVQACVRVTL